MPKKCPHEPLSTTEERGFNLWPLWNATGNRTLPCCKQPREIFIFPLPLTVQELILLFRTVLGGGWGLLFTHISSASW
jgi:hypothetical protein